MERKNRIDEILGKADDKALTSLMKAKNIIDFAKQGREWQGAVHEEIAQAIDTMLEQKKITPIPAEQIVKFLLEDMHKIKDTFVYSSGRGGIHVHNSGIDKMKDTARRAQSIVELLKDAKAVTLEQANAAFVAH